MHVTLRLGDQEFDLYLVREGTKIKIEVDGETYEATLDEGQAGAFRVNVGGQTIAVTLQGDDVVVDGESLSMRVERFQPGGAPGAHGAGGAAGGARVKPPMPGKIVDVKVKPGETVKAGQVLLILEAMKMQNEIPSPVAGTVKEVHAKTGSSVEPKDILVVIE